MWRFHLRLLRLWQWMQQRLLHVRSLNLWHILWFVLQHQLLPTGPLSSRCLPPTLLRLLIVVDLKNTFETRPASCWVSFFVAP